MFRVVFVCGASITVAARRERLVPDSINVLPAITDRCSKAFVRGGVVSDLSGKGGVDSFPLRTVLLGLINFFRKVGIKVCGKH